MQRFLLLSLSCLPLAAAVYQAPTEEPTADEVAILELMNRFRADPVADAKRILDSPEVPAFMWRNVDRDMFKAEVEALPTAPALVFDLDALRAARRHSYYMIHNGLTHDEVAGKEGFVAVSFGERMKAAGFSGSPGGENCFKEAGNPWLSHCGFVIDFGEGGTGGMQKGRGHRMNMANGRFNVIGPGAVPNSSRISVTHNLGTVKGRFVGGAVYTDRNGNGFYDVGEGRGGVLISSADGKLQTRTWASGGYVLPIPSAVGGLVFEVGSVRHQVAIDTGSANVAISWAVPSAEELAACDALLAVVDGLPDDDQHAERRRKALIDLWVGSRFLALDQARRDRVDTLAGTLGKALRTDQDAILAAIDSGDAANLREAQKAAKAWNGTAAKTWFDEAAVLAKANEGARGYTAAKAAGKTIDEKLVKRLTDSLSQARDQATDPEIRSAFAALLASITP